MSFSLEHRTLRSGNVYNLKTRPEMFVHEEPSSAACEPNAAELIKEADAQFSSDLIDEKIKGNLEPLHAQNSALTQMMDKLIQDNLAGAYPMEVPAIVGSRPNLRWQPGPERPEPCC